MEVCQIRHISSSNSLNFDGLLLFTCPFPFGHMFPCCPMFSPRYAPLPGSPKFSILPLCSPPSPFTPTYAYDS